MVLRSTGMDSTPDTLKLFSCHRACEWLMYTKLHFLWLKELPVFHKESA